MTKYNDNEKNNTRSKNGSRVTVMEMKKKEAFVRVEVGWKKVQSCALRIFMRHVTVVQSPISNGHQTV